MAKPHGTIDTIVAIASPAGRGAVGVIRISGAEVPRIAGELLGAVPAPRTARLARFLDETGAALDQGLALYFPAPQSFTGEHVLELQGHGGALVMDLLLQRALSLGCRMARPGEFSERAFLNGKMDVTQAEAVADLIDAGTAAAALAAVRSMQGEFSRRIQELQSQLTELRAYVEAAIDFSEEDIDFLAQTAFTDRLSRLFAAFDSIESAARQGALLREGLNVVIAGKPNAGKSSVLNRLVGEDVAIVTDVPGTTRDLLRQPIQLDGLPLNLIDTAGLRTAVDAVEAEGIRRAKVEIRRADRVLYVVDASVTDDFAGESTSAGEAATLEVETATLAAPGGTVAQPEVAADLARAFMRDAADVLAGVPVTVLVNKIDLVGVAAHLDESAAPTRIFMCARTGEGLELLRAHLKAVAGFRDGEAGVLSARRRHLDALSRAARLVHDAAEALPRTQALELFAEDLRLAQRALGEITGEFTSDDLLGEIFGSFCIGK